MKEDGRLGSQGRGGFRRALAADSWGLLALPAILLLVVAFVVPLAAVALRSVTENSSPEVTNYQRFLSDPASVRVMLTTFRMAVLTTLGALVIGYPLAYLLNALGGRMASLLLLAVLVPFWTSALVRTYAWVVLLRDTGVINETLLAIGAITEPIPLIRTTHGVTIAMTYVMTPYMVLLLLSVMRRIDPAHMRAAASLGAGPMAAFRRVFLPLSMPGVVAGCLLVFVVSLGFYVTPVLIGSPRDQMISQAIVMQVSGRLDWGYGSALAVILLAATLLALLAASRVVRVDDVFGSGVPDHSGR